MNYIFTNTHSRSKGQLDTAQQEDASSVCKQGLFYKPIVQELVFILHG